MHLIKRLCLGAAAIIAVAVAGSAVWLTIAPPQLLRLGDGYAAKLVCSNVFIAGRDPQDVLDDDVQAQGNPALKLIHVSVDRDIGLVTASFLGLFAPNYALYRGALGCVTVPDHDLKAAERLALASTPVARREAPWPDGDQVTTDANGLLSQIIQDPALAGPGMRAIVVVKDGQIAAETYGKGFRPETPLLGWSMAKTVNAAIIGRLMQQGKMSFDDTDLLPAWHDDGRARIRLSDLLAMESGLAFDEAYDGVTDVTRMLYLEPDMASMVEAVPQAHPPGQTFAYSTGTAILLSRIWMNRFTDQNAALAFPHDALFAPLGMASAVLEADEHGTFVSGSYLYATARDWARFGEFLLKDGVWHGQRLLPEGFVGAMRTPTKASDGVYTQAQAWLAAPGGASKKFGLPEDTFWMLGYDGQSVTIVPSAGLVVVRLGVTPGRLHYRPQLLVKKLLDAMSSVKT